MVTSVSSGAAANAYVPAATTVPASKAQANLAVNLANDASLIAGIGGSASTDAGLYNAQGLLNNILPSSAANGTTSAAGDNGGADAASGASGTDTGTTASANGTDTANTFNGTPDWATVLKANPSMTGVFLADSTDNLLVKQLSVFA